MYEAYHPGGKIPESAVSNIIDELKARLDKIFDGLDAETNIAGETDISFDLTR